MDVRRLGLGGLRVSKIGLGGISMSHGYGPSDETESIGNIHRALELGVTFIDTANNYEHAHNERLIGRAVGGRRDEVTLATKFGLDVNRRSSKMPFGSVNGRPEYVRACCDESLTHLGTEYIDLYYQHRVDPDVPIEETVGAMAELVDAGKVRYLGLSEASAESLVRAAATHPISALQCEWSLWCRDVEDEVVPTARRLGIGLVAYRPLGIGLLAGQVKTPADLPADDLRRGDPRFQGENFERNLHVVAEVRRLAAQKGVSAAQYALAWLLARGEDVVPIPGTKRREKLEENAAAATISLDAAELDRLEVVAPRDGWAGRREISAGHGDSPRAEPDL